VLENDLAEIPELKHIGTALAQFARSLFPGSDFKREGSRWVFRPENYVTFSVHSARSRHIRLSLRGNRDEFSEHKTAPLKKGRNPSWSECIISEPAQLLAVASYIDRAAELFKRGRGRVHKKPVLVER
jgi:hypothetical protein